MPLTARPVVAALLACGLAGGAAISTQAAQQQATPPIPRPFPQPVGSTTAAPPTKAADPAPATQAPASSAQNNTARVSKPTETDLGVQFYPGSEFLDSYDAGKGQRYYLFGTNDAYADVVAFYKHLRGGGSEIFKAPPMQRFDLDVRFREETMAFPPSVVVKDYTWNNSEGYLSIDGTRERRFKTIIQIVPAPAR